MAAPRISIDEVEIDRSGRILVRPRIASSEQYEYIYRAASGVRWMSEARVLAPYETKDGSPAWWFRQIVVAVRDEYRQVLVLQPDTRWINVSIEDRSEIEATSNNAV
jgi:hypothetical protein